jgi:putative flippase GtrA
MNIKDSLKNQHSDKALIQFLKFCVVGLSNTVISLAVYYIILYFGAHYVIASILSFIISVLNAYYWNYKYVFNTKSDILKSLIKTYTSYGFSYVLSTTLLIILVEYYNISELLAPILVLVITVPLNFILNKFWAFK